MARPAHLRLLFATASVMLCVLGAAGAVAVRSPQPGIDPEKEPLVGAFNCYTTAAGDGYATPGFVLQILPGRRYRTPAGEGAFAIDPGETLSIKWTTGPLVNFVDSAVRFTDQGQSIVYVTPAGADKESLCHQQGPRDEAAQIEFRAKDPQPGTFPCVPEGGGTAPPLEILPGRGYAVGGVTGAFTLNILGKQSEKWSTIDFVGGPLDGNFGLYTPDIELGLRSLSIGVSGAPDLNCDIVVAPTPLARFGPTKAPRRPRARVPIVGMYAAFQPDVVGACGGLCWTFRTFTANGYVYTNEPDTGRGDAACDRRLANGLPVCDRYLVRGRTIQIGDEPPVSFARGKNQLRIDGRTFSLVQPLGAAARLDGGYKSFSYTSAAPGQGGVAVETIYQFTAAGRFTREGFAAATASPPPGQPGVSVTVAAQNGNAGRYRVLPALNALELRFDNGAVRRVFAFVPTKSGSFPTPKSLHLGGRDYLRR